jgi:transcriptional regulator with PAS, ATPase and Fis domain
MVPRPDPSPVLLHHVLECLPGPAVIIGGDYRILAANRAYRGAFAAIHEEVVGRSCHEVSHRYAAPCDQAGQTCPVSRCRDTSQPSRMVHVHATTTGEQHEEVTTYPIADEAGGVSAFLELIRPAPLASARASQDGFMGRSPAFNRMLELASRVAASDTPVLLLGESGTGNPRMEPARGRAVGAARLQRRDRVAVRERVVRP